MRDVLLLINLEHCGLCQYFQYDISLCEFNSHTDLPYCYENHMFCSVIARIQANVALCT